MKYISRLVCTLTHCRCDPDPICVDSEGSVHECEHCGKLHYSPHRIETVTLNE
jgi:hypothetical protein